mgnify:CR=1 FL=1
MAVASRIKGITIEIDGDPSKLKTALSKVDQSIRTTQGNLKDLDRALKLDPGNTELIKDKQQELAREISDTEKKLKTEKEALDQLKNSDGFDENSREAQNLKTQIDLDTAALKDLEKQAKDSSSVLGQQMKVAGDKIKEVGDKIKGVGDGIADLGSTMTTKVTAPIVGALGGSVKAAIDWETAFTGVKKTVNATDEEFAQLEQNIKDMATRTASSKEDIAGVMEIAGQLGVTGVDGLTKFTETMINLNDTTNLSAEDAATNLARFMNITGDSYENADKLGSSIVDLGNNFATTEAEIVNMATRLAADGTIAGLTSTEILGLAASMSSVGLEAEAGGTAMSQTLKGITKAVADSGPKLEELAEISGMTADEFSETWKKSPIDALNAFITGLASMDDASINTIKALDELDMSGIRQSRTLQSLALASDQLTGAIETSDTAYEENNALQEEAQKRYDTQAAKLSQLKERFMNVAVEIGEMLMPTLEKLTGFIESLIDQWNALDESEKENILKTVELIAAVGPLLIIIGNVVGAIGTIVSALGILLPILASPVGIVLAIIAAVAALAYAIYKNWDKIKAFLADAKEGWDKLVANIKQKIDDLKQKFDLFKQAIGIVWTAIKEAVVGKAKEIFDKAKTTFSNMKTNIQNTFTNIKNGITNTVGNIKNAIVNGFGKAVDFIKNLPSKALSWGKDLIQNFVNGIWNKIGAVTEVISNVADKVKSFLGFSEPEDGPLSNFHTFAPDMIKLFAQGIEQSLPMLERATNDMAAVIASDATPSIQNGQAAASKTVNAPISINVYGAQGQDVNQLADIIQAKMNRAVVNQKAVFA